MQLSKYEEQLSQNPSYTPEMVNQEIQNKFELMLTGVEDNIYQMNNVKKEDVNKASDMLQNDRDFKRATYRLRSMFAVMQGQTPEPPDVSVVGVVHPQLPEFMTLSYTLEVMKEVMSKAAEVISAVPDSARVSEMVGREADPNNHLLMHAMGPNVAGVIGSAVAAGILLGFLG